MKNLLKCMILALGALTSSIISADVVVNVNKGVHSAINISISTNSPEAGLEDFVRSIIEKDLKNCGAFNPIPHQAFMEKLVAGETPNFALWEQIRSPYLVDVGVVSNGNTVYMTMRLYDVFSKKEIGYFYISGEKSNMRLMAHMVSNKIYERIIGEKGYFDTQVLYVATVKNKKMKNYRIAIMDQDGDNLRYLTNGAFTVLTPRISPNGKEFAYFMWDERIMNGRRIPISGAVYIYNLSANRSRLIRKFKGMSYAPRFSPDGNTLIFSLSHKGSSSIYTYDIISGKMTRITKGPYIDTSPCYSPDGKKIVFNSDRAGKQRLYIMDADGRNIQPFGTGKGRYATPVWSPRGDWIAFTRFGVGGFFIGICRPDGTGERMLSSGYLVEGPTWSNNGHVLMFSHQDYRGNNRIFSVDVTGYNKHEVSTKTQATDPEWSSAKSDEAIRKGSVVIHKDTIGAIALKNNAVER